MKPRYIINIIGDNEEAQIRIEHNKYDKHKIENDFIKLCDLSLPGEVVEYWKQDEKWLYNPLLTVENINGTLKRWIVKGNKTFYAKFNYFGKIIRK